MGERGRGIIVPFYSVQDCGLGLVTVLFFVYKTFPKLPFEM